MAIALSVTEKANVQRAIDLMLVSPAPEIPVDSTCMEAVGKAARAVGFTVTGKTFEQAVRDQPVSTLLKLVLFVGA